jgi:hypothetical protein
MNGDNNCAISLIIVGLIVLIFHKFIIKIQGASKSKFSYTIEERKWKLISGGILAIMVGLFFLLKKITL